MSRFTFATELCGYISIAKDSGKYNNRSFSFVIPPETLTEMEEDRKELLKWATSKVQQRCTEGMLRWDDEGLCRYSFGAGLGGGKGRQAPVFIDSDRKALSKETLSSVAQGTKAILIVDQKPWVMKKTKVVGTLLHVLGVQITELVTSSQLNADRELSESEVIALFAEFSNARTG